MIIEMTRDACFWQAGSPGSLITRIPTLAEAESEATEKEREGKIALGSWLADSSF